MQTLLTPVAFIISIMLFGCSNKPDTSNRSLLDSYEQHWKDEYEAAKNITPADMVNDINKTGISDFLWAKRKYEMLGDVEQADTKEEILEYRSVFVDCQSQAAIAVDIKVDSIQKEAKQLLKELKAKRPAVFSTLRRNYIRWASQEAWLDDISVFGNGGDNKIITFAHHSFVTNRKKQDAYELLRDMLEKLEFKQVRFKWYKEDDEYTYYDLH